MSDEEFIQLLKNALIRKGSGSEKDYLEARKWAGTVARDHGNYEHLVRLAAQYVGV